jgi:DNA-binding CsgD family transcriptional regulator
MLSSVARTVQKSHQRHALFARLGEVTYLVGQPAFYPELLAALAAHLQAELSMMMRYSKRNAPEYLIHNDLQAEHMEIYLHGLYRVDPIYRLCRNETGEGVKDLTEISTPAELAGDYFKIFLRLTGMSDDLAILFPVGAEDSLGLVYERRSTFSRREIAEMRALFPMLNGLHKLHQRELCAAPHIAAPAVNGQASPRTGLPPVDYKIAVDAFLQTELTPRERDIVGLVLLGYPTAKIADKLGLSVNTIKNHRKRMYSKLDITTERELFLNFVNFLFTDTR